MYSSPVRFCRSRDLLALDQNIGLPRSGRPSERPVLDDFCGHCSFLFGPASPKVPQPFLGSARLVRGASGGSEGPPRLTPRSPPSPRPRGTARSAPALAQSLEISSASLCDSPSTQGHITMAVGATRLIQQASCPRPRRGRMWLNSPAARRRCAPRRTQPASKVTGSKPPTFSNATCRPMSSATASAALRRRAFHVLDHCPSSGERKSTVNTALPGITLRELG